MINGAIVKQLQQECSLLDSADLKGERVSYLEKHYLYGTGGP